MQPVVYAAYTLLLKDDFSNQFTAKNFPILAAPYSGFILNFCTSDYLLSNCLLFGASIKTCHIQIGEHKDYIWFIRFFRSCGEHFVVGNQPGFYPVSTDGLIKA